MFVNITYMCLVENSGRLPKLYLLRIMLTPKHNHMKIPSMLVGVVTLAGMSVGSAHLFAAPDPGKNFTDSDSPDTTVFNLQVPSDNRHIVDHTKSRQPVQPRPVVDTCDAGIVMDYVDKYLVRLEKSAPAMVAINEPYAYSYSIVAKDKVKKVVVEEQIPAGTVYVSSDPQAEIQGSKVTWTLYNVVAGSTTPLTLVVKPTAVADLSSCATITAYPEACTTTLVGQPKLEIVKSTPEPRVLLGSGIPWNITVTNVGNFCAFDVVVTDTLPSGVTHTSGSST